MEDGAQGGGSTATVTEDSLDAGSGQTIGLEQQCLETGDSYDLEGRFGRKFSE